MVKEKEIKEFLIKLLKEKNIIPDKIVIFGSCIKGGMREESDIDVIIVSRDFRGKSIFERVKMITGVGRSLIKKFSLPFDILCYSDIEWENNNSIIIHEAK